MTLDIRSHSLSCLGRSAKATFWLHMESRLTHSILFMCQAKILFYQSSVSFWHSRLGHMSRKAMETLSRLGCLPKLCFSDFNFCEHCMYGKQTCTSRNVSFEKERQPLELIHSDICGPMPTRSLGGSQYFVTFIDDAIRKVWVYTIKSKDHTFACFQ